MGDWSWARLRRWAVSTRPAAFRVLHCPVCGRVMRKRVGAANPGVGGLGWLTDRELAARCPVDGQPPWNTPTMHKVEGIEVDG